MPYRNAYKILQRLKKPLPEVYARSVGKFVQLYLLKLIKHFLDDDRIPQSLYSRKGRRDKKMEKSHF